MNGFMEDVLQRKEEHGHRIFNLTPSYLEGLGYLILLTLHQYWFNVLRSS